MKKFSILGVLAVVLGLGVVAGVFAMLGGDAVTSSYETYADAKADRLFERGWLPPIIPESAAKITAVSYPDTNTADGEFYFAPADGSAFVERLNKADETGSEFSEWGNLIATGYTTHSYSKSGSTWHFVVHPSKGHARFQRVP